MKFTQLKEDQASEQLALDMDNPFIRVTNEIVHGADRFYILRCCFESRAMPEKAKPLV
jgi:hypothetical protein